MIAPDLSPAEIEADEAYRRWSLLRRRALRTLRPQDIRAADRAWPEFEKLYAALDSGSQAGAP